MPTGSLHKPAALPLSESSDIPVHAQDVKSDPASFIGHRFDLFSTTSADAGRQSPSDRPFYTCPFESHLPTSNFTPELQPDLMGFGISPVLVMLQ